MPTAATGAFPSRVGAAPPTRPGPGLRARAARPSGSNRRASTTWRITGTKTNAYRQVDNAFPPPVARAVGQQIAKALGALPDGQGAPEREAVA